MLIEQPAFTIRPVRLDETPAILEVYRQCEDFLALTPNPTATMKMVEDDLAISRAAAGDFCGIYDKSGHLIGIVDVVLKGFDNDPETAFIELIMIGRPYRRGGIGSAVIAAVENEMTRDEEVKTIALGVMVNNPDAVRFWERHGYHKVAGPLHMDDGTTTWQMRKPVLRSA